MEWEAEIGSGSNGIDAKRVIDAAEKQGKWSEHCFERERQGGILSWRY